MTFQGWILILGFVAVLLVLTRPVGRWLFALYEGRRTPLHILFGPVEAGFYRLAGIDPGREQGWRRYAVHMLLFNVVPMIFTYAVLRLQGLLPGNPQGLPGVLPPLAFNTAISFATNTNWQSYAGESTLSNLSQMLGLTIHNFLSSATGIALAFALFRGFARREAGAIGNFWADVTRVTLYLLLPLSIVYAVFLMASGVPQTLAATVDVTTLEGARQVLAIGPVASQEAIKMLGTNGGGFFNANSAHPFENPTALTNLVQMLSIFLIGFGLTWTFGKAVGNLRQGRAILAAMVILFLAGVTMTYAQEAAGNPVLHQLGVAGGNMEGKEVRFGIAASALFAVVTTAASCGAVNAMHDSFTALGGLIPLFNIQLGEIVIGGVGAGIYGFLLFAILAVFAAPLTVLLIVGQDGLTTGFKLQLVVWLWLTVLFGTFAEALAEGRGKAQAASLRAAKAELTAKRLRGDGRAQETVPASALRIGDIVLVETGDLIPSDGEVVAGVASVNEAAITGESAPVIREAGGDRSAVTAGTRVLSDEIRVRVTVNPGEGFIDRMIALVEGAQRQKTPNEIALTLLLVGLTIIFLIAVATIPGFAQYAGGSIPVAMLAALLITLIPTTIAALLSAIGIAGMDRLVRFNVLAKSGRAVEAAGDIDVLLLDKTGTITIGDRQASAFRGVGGATDAELTEAALIASLADETPEGRSIVVLARAEFGVRTTALPAGAEVIPFTAQTRISGVRTPDMLVQKGAVESILRACPGAGESAAGTELRRITDEIARAGGTPLAVARDGRLLGAIFLKDVVKAGIRERFGELRAMGIRTVMITGDNPLTAAAIAAEAGVDDFLAQASPEDKLALIRAEQQGGRLVAMCGDGTNDAPALAQATADYPDAILLDLGLPDRDGLELISLLRGGGTVVLVVSARDATEQKVAALDLGVHDFVTKPFDTDELLARLRVALRHSGGTGAAEILRRGDVTIDRDRRLVCRAGGVVHLTRKEQDVLALLAHHAGRVVTHTRILAVAWAGEADPRVEYLRIVIRNLRQKLEAPGPVGSLIANEPGVGYRLRSDG